MRATAGSQSAAEPSTAVTARARVATLVGVFLASRIVAHLGVIFLAATRGRIRLLWVIARAWDGSWNLELAAHGYPKAVPPGTGPAAQSTLAFFPGYAVLVRVADAFLPGNGVWAALTVSLAAGAVATVGVARVAERVVRPDAGLAAAAMFTLFPGAFILTLAYGEGLLIALAAWCLVFLLDRRWLAAGLCAMAATATRPNGVVLVACCLVAAIPAYRAGDRRAWIAPALAPLGAVAVFAYLWVRTADPLVWFRAEDAGWLQHTDFGVWTLRSLGWFVTGRWDIETVIIGLGVVVATVGSRALVRLRPPPAILVWMVGVLALCYTSSSLNGRPRFLLTAFPLLLPLARLPWRRLAPVLAVSGGLMTFLLWHAGANVTVAP